MNERKDSLDDHSSASDDEEIFKPKKESKAQRKKFKEIEAQA